VVATLYEQLGGFGDVERNVYIPDKITGQPRQIDVLNRIHERGHTLTIVVDAKFHETKLDVKDIGEEKGTGVNCQTSVPTARRDRLTKSELVQEIQKPST
jgi:hypothetical protein